MRSSTRAVLVRAVAAVAVVVLLLGGVAGGLSLLGDDGDGAGDGGRAAGAEPLALTRTVTGLAGLGPLVGGDDLPATPTAPEGVVLDPSGSRASEADVRALLDALGLDAEPQRVGGGWTAEGRVRGERGAFALDEKAGNVWQLATGEEAGCLAVRPGAGPEDSVSSCSATLYRTDDGGPSRERLDRLAAGLFDLLGVRPGAGLRVLWPGNGRSTLDVPLEVEDLPVAGLTLSVTVDADGITGALGWLRPSFRPLGPYPLVSARDALTTLQSQPVPEIASCALPTDERGEPVTDRGCETPEPAEVTGARLAWMTSFDGARTLLVPAWQYETDGLYGPAAVAVAPSHLVAPGQ